MAEVYPTFLAGQRLTPTLLTSAQAVVARKTADTSRSSTATPAADPHLTFEVVAGGVYVMDGWLKFDGAAAGDLSIDWSMPSGSLGEWTGWGPGVPAVVGVNTTPALVTDTASTRGYLLRIETNDVSQVRTFGCIAVGTTLTIKINGTLRVGSTAGTYSLDWSQVTSDPTATTLYTDSWLRLQRVA